MTTNSHQLDTTGLICPEPIMLLHKTIRQANSGDIILMRATDPASCRDVANFCRHLGHKLLKNHQENGVYHYTIEKK